MIRPVMLGVSVVLLAAGASGAVQAQTPPAASAAGGYSIQSTVGDLLDNPATKAVLAKYAPQMVANPQLEEGRPYPLEGIASYAPELTPETLAKIDAELKAIPKKP